MNTIKYNRKSLIFITTIIIFILLSLLSKCFAYGNLIPIDDTAFSSSTGTANSSEILGWNLSKSGVQWTVIVRDSENPEVIYDSYTKEMFCIEGQASEAYGDIKGWGVTGYDMDKPNQLTGKELEFSSGDVVAFLQKNKPSVLETIKSKSNCDVILIGRAFYHVKLNLGNNKFKDLGYLTWPQLVSKTTNEYGTGINYNFYTAFMKKGGISEEDQTLWADLANQIGISKTEETRVNAIGYLKGGFNQFQGWCAALYSNFNEPPEVPTKPADMLTDNKPVIVGQIDDDDGFNVYDKTSINGNPIPTTEYVDVKVDSNLYGTITGITRECKELQGLNLNGTINAKYYALDENGSLVEKTATQKYNGQTTGKIFWLNASNATVNKNIQMVVENAILPNGKVTFNQSAGTVSISKQNKRGSYTLKDGSINYTYNVSATDKAALDKLYALYKNEGSSWAESELVYRLNTMKIEAEERVKEITPFFNVTTDTITFHGNSIERNGALTYDFYTVQDTKQVQNVANKSVNGNAYITTGTAAKTDTAEGYTIKSPNFEKMNNVRVHTPINREIFINGMPMESTILIKEKDANELIAKVTLDLDRASTYYQNVSGLNIRDYIKEIELSIKVNGVETHSKTIQGSSLNSSLTLAEFDLSEIPEGAEVKIYATVTAINKGASGAANLSANANINVPDDVYILTSEGKITVYEEVDKGGYTLEEPPEDSVCNKEIEVEAKIDNYEFRVAEGNLIPTSEYLFAKGTTNLVGKLQGIKKWKLKFSDDYEKTFKIKARYIKGYSIDYREEQLVDGVWVTTNTQTYNYSTYEEAEHATHNYQFTDVTIRKTYSDIETNYSDWYYSIRKFTKSTAPDIAYTVTTNATVDDKVIVNITNAALGGTRTKIFVTEDITLSGKGTKAGNESSRVEIKNEMEIGSNYSSLSQMMEALNNYAPYITDFVKVESDKVMVSVNGSNQVEYTNNCPILTTDFDGVLKLVIEGPQFHQSWIPLIENGEKTSTGTLTCGGETYTIPNINSVNIYTPIHDELVVTASTINRLSQEEYEEKVKLNGYPIAKLGDTVTATVTVSGTVRGGYATTVNPEKYIKEVIIDCGLCGAHDVKARNESSTYTHTTYAHTYTHTCTIPITQEDGRTYEITSTVVAENIPSTLGVIKDGTYNTENNEYRLIRKSAVYVVGEIYDFEVRTTNDPDWKTEAEKLDKLPTGEAGDNNNSLYKYGIKLGYSAYFDLKTLGIKSTNIKLVPKIYYVSKDGNTIKENPDLYYRTKSGYVKLGSSDIDIKMALSNTNGAVNNGNFLKEQINSAKSAFYSGVDYKSIKSIGGLLGITLGKNNSVTTTYNGEWYLDGKENVSRRWFGEIYLPASTVVAKTGATLAQVANKTKTYEEGYLVVMFEKVYSTLADGTSEYLDYNVRRDGNADAYESQVLKEKDGKTQIKLPNSVTRDLNADAAIPVIVYDVSQRANNDYETSGTH